MKFVAQEPVRGAPAVPCEEALSYVLEFESAGTILNLDGGLGPVTRVDALDDLLRSVVIALVKGGGCASHLHAVRNEAAEHQKLQDDPELNGGEVRAEPRPRAGTEQYLVSLIQPRLHLAEEIGVPRDVVVGDATT